MISDLGARQTLFKQCQSTRRSFINLVIRALRPHAVEYGMGDKVLSNLSSSYVDRIAGLGELSTEVTTKAVDETFEKLVTDAINKAPAPSIPRFKAFHLPLLNDFPWFVRPDGFCLPPLDNSDEKSVLLWLRYALEKRTVYPISRLPLEQGMLMYASYLEGGQFVDMSTYLQDWRSRLATGQAPSCRMFDKTANEVAIWLSGVTPPWHQSYVEYQSGRQPIDKSSSDIGLKLLRSTPAGPYEMRFVWVGNRASFRKYQQDKPDTFDCDGVRIDPAKLIEPTISPANSVPARTAEAGIRATQTPVPTAVSINRANATSTPPKLLDRESLFRELNPIKGYLPYPALIRVGNLSSSISYRTTKEELFRAGELPTQPRMPALFGASHIERTSMDLHDLAVHMNVSVSAPNVRLDTVYRAVQSALPRDCCGDIDSFIYMFVNSADRSSFQELRLWGPSGISSGTNPPRRSATGVSCATMFLNDKPIRSKEFETQWFDGGPVRIDGVYSQELRLFGTVTTVPTTKTLSLAYEYLWLDPHTGMVAAYGGESVQWGKGLDNERSVDAWIVKASMIVLLPDSINKISGVGVPEECADLVAGLR